MTNNPIQTNYISEIDQLLLLIDKNNPSLSVSQQKERNKFLRVANLRDNPARPDTTSLLWEGF